MEHRRILQDNEKISQVESFDVKKDKWHNDSDLPCPYCISNPVNDSIVFECLQNLTWDNKGNKKWNGNRPIFIIIENESDGPSPDGEGSTPIALEQIMIIKVLNKPFYGEKWKKENYIIMKLKIWNK